MPTKSRTSSKERPVGPNIVRAWFDTVINPLLRGLRSERNLLDKENWTWRFEQRTLISLVPVRSFIAFETLDNLDQFLNLVTPANKKCLPLMDLHDEQLENLCDICREFHRALISSKELQGLYKRISKDGTIPIEPGRDFNSLFGAYRPDRHLDVLAEDIVNGTGRLPEYYSTAPLWNLYREDFLGIRETADIRPHWEASRKAGRALNQTVLELTESLRRIREELSLQHDVPPVELSRT
jgi:hypothetical protein